MFLRSLCSCLRAFLPLTHSLESLVVCWGGGGGGGGEGECGYEWFGG